MTDPTPDPRPPTPATTGKGRVPLNKPPAMFLPKRSGSGIVRHSESTRRSPMQCTSTRL